MKYIYVLPLESQNITNFTFWKAILLEIDEVHWIQGNPFPATTSETDTLPSVPSNEGFVRFLLKHGPKGSQLREVWVNSCQKLQWRSWSYHLGLPSNSTLEKITLPQKGAVFAGHWASAVFTGRQREAHSSRAQTPSPATCNLSHGPEEISSSD